MTHPIEVFVPPSCVGSAPTATAYPPAAPATLRSGDVGGRSAIMTSPVASKVSAAKS